LITASTSRKMPGQNIAQRESCMAEYFTKYPGRFFSMHLQDWNAETKTAAAVGKGTIDWKKVFAAAKTGGVRNYFIEQNMEMTREGIAFLKALVV
jgi:sugar phosphate isomerase/epimerase